MAESDYIKNDPKLDGVPDLTSLTYLEVPNVLDNLEHRWLKMKPKEIYTAVSTVLIAINPYEYVKGLYTEEMLKHFEEQVRQGMSKMKPPHPFGVGARSFSRMIKNGTNQSVVVCGESGSGKTETTKQVIKYLADTSGGDDITTGDTPLEAQIVAASPILEAFGNAKTTLNNNSSRFGKFTKILYAGHDQANAGSIVGTEIETYLLEKSRVIMPNDNERNFHAFYFTWAGLSDAQRKEWGCEDIMKFSYANQGGCAQSPGIDDKVWFDEMVESLEIYKIDESDRLNLFKMLMGILHMGNIKFKKNDQDYAEVDKKSVKHLEHCAQLWDLSSKQVEKRMTTTSMGKGKRKTTKNIAYKDAATNRDSVTKGLYENIFLFLAGRISAQLSSSNSNPDSCSFIGVLDVFGFENFLNNSLEQFCINYTNERLQQFFNVSIIESEQETYIAESVLWTEIEVPDSRPMLALVGSLFGCLQDQCGVPTPSLEFLVQEFDKGVDKKTDLLVNITSKGAVKRKKKLKRRKKQVKVKFGATFKHFAAYVEYNFDLFIEKNMEKISRDTKDMFKKSKNTLLVEIATMKRKRGKNDGLTKIFEKSLSSLMKTLQKTEPFFVRCVNPNMEKSNKVFDRGVVEKQLRVGGLVEALRVLKEGYPTRVNYQEIYDLYHHKIDHPLIQRLPVNKFAAAVLIAFDVQTTDYELGLTKIFFKPAKADVLDEIMEQADSLSDEQMGRIITWLAKARIKALFGCMKCYKFFGDKVRDMKARENWEKTGRKLEHMVILKTRLDFVRKRIQMRSLMNILYYHRAYKTRQDVRAKVAGKKEIVEQIWSAYIRFARSEKVIPLMEKSVEDNKEKIRKIMEEQQKIAEAAAKSEEARIKAENDAADKERQLHIESAVKELTEACPKKVKRKKYREIDKWMAALPEYVEKLVKHFELDMKTDGKEILNQVEQMWKDAHAKESARLQKIEDDKIAKEQKNRIKLTDARSNMQIKREAIAKREANAKKRQRIAIDKGIYVDLDEWVDRAKKGIKCMKYVARITTHPKSGKKIWQFGKREATVTVEFDHREPTGVRWGSGPKRIFHLKDIEAIGIGFKTRAFRDVAKVQSQFKSLDQTCVVVIGPKLAELNFQHENPLVVQQWVNGLKAYIEKSPAEMEAVFNRIHNRDMEASARGSVKSPQVTSPRTKKQKRKDRFDSTYQRMFHVKYLKVMKVIKRDHNKEIGPQFQNVLGEEVLLKQATAAKIKWSRLDYWIRKQVDKFLHTEENADEKPKVNSAVIPKHKKHKSVTMSPDVQVKPMTPIDDTIVSGGWGGADAVPAE